MQIYNERGLISRSLKDEREEAVLVVGLENIEGRFSQSLASRSEFHNAGTLCRRNLRRDWAGDFVE